MKNMRKIVCKGFKGRKDEINIIVTILSVIYGFCFLFIMLQESYLKMKTEYTYMNRMTAVDEFFINGKFMICLFLFSTILIFYALNVSVKKRKYRICILRGMGATFAQLVVMSIWEGLIIVAVSVLVGITIGMLGSGVTLLVGKYFFGWKMSFAIDFVYLFQSFLFTTVLFGVSMIISAMYLSSNQMNASFKLDSGILQREKMPEMKSVKPLHLVRIARRNKQFYQSKTYLNIVFSVLVILIMTMSLFEFGKENKKYKFWSKQTSYYYQFRNDVLTDGISRQTIEKLEKIPGITKVDREKYLNMCGIPEGEIQIGFDGWKESEYVKIQRHYAQDKIRQSWDKEGDYLSVSEIRGVSPTDTQLLSAYEKEEKQGVFEREKFNRGEECLLFLTPYQVRDLGFDSVDYEASFIRKDDVDKSKKIYTYENDENAIEPGDTVEIRTPWGNAAITVGGIVCGIPESYGNVIAVGERFLDKIFDESTSELYNDIAIWYDENTDFAEVDRKVIGVFRELGLEEDLYNERIFAKQNLDAMMSEMFLSMTIMLMSALLYVIITYQMNLGYFDEERRRIGIFQSIGMDRRRLEKLYVLEGIFDVVFVFIWSLLCVGIWMVFRLRAVTSFDSLNRFVKELLNHEESLKMGMEAFLISSGFFVLVYSTAIYFPIRKKLKRNMIDNIK